MLPAVLAAHGGGIETGCRAWIGCRHVRRLGWLLASVLPSHASVRLAPELLPVDLSAADVHIRLEQVKRQMIWLMLLLEQVYLLLFLRAELGLLQTKKREKECVSDIEDALGEVWMAKAVVLLTKVRKLCCAAMSSSVR